MRVGRKVQVRLRLRVRARVRVRVRCLGEALERARLHDGLTEGDDRVGYLDLHAAAC